MIDTINGRTRLYGLFAHPAKHSLSPLMHNLSFRKRGINAVYLAFDLTGDLGDAVNSIRQFDMGGVNLSMPFKRTVIPFLDELTPTADLIGAVNTIMNRDGRLIGANTDGTGFFAHLAANGYATKQKTATILGAGGAGLSIIAAGASKGLSTIHVFKRRNASFPAVSDQLRQIAAAYPTTIQLHDYNDEAALQRALSESDFLINSTNIGMGDDAKLPVAEALIDCLSPSAVVCDAIYEPRQTRFLHAAKQRGCITFNGLGMLIYQGAQAFQRWTDQEMPIDDVEDALLKELDQNRS
ncbi:shikimate/quinate 5-dehydrogenase I beta [Sporolactobacillus inulinus]|uniref:Shikimate dehydrogenase (NADP(+)) n=1 Tax=Sporolactobacillus inulinus TaxID=2078 RepID=A0A4Y1ZC22_9BACL|nr:shikimate dehydrogenase [Sporolactobacillus inulinus]GAY76560.1 shikimate/quinate 5-dehydrogenase I beta [Sporolactobacillus inulinus]